MFGNTKQRTTRLYATTIMAAAGSLVAMGAPRAWAGQQTNATVVVPSAAAAANAGVADDPSAYAAAARSQDWVHTPEGLVNKTCVRTLPAGAHMDGQDIVLADGARTAPAPCAHPRLVDSPPAVKSAAASSPDVVVPAPLSGWFIFSNWASPGPLRGITSDYTVPNAPSVNGAVNYFFSSLRSSGDTDGLEAVLGYGANGVSGTGNFWYVQPWYVYGNQAVAEPPVRVNAGDTIAAFVEGNDCNANGTGCFFTITATDVNTGPSTTMHVTSDESFISAQGGVFASEGSQHCTYLPANGNVNFYNIKVFGNTGAQVTPTFSTIQPDPECSMYEDLSKTETYITWQP